ncbi:hypothetical protein [Fodinibius salsisoli]|uniref:Lipoprotein n=1 Tax=Fodinibius salsisoli TaxID=2820877 RepID=A0ABT3PQA0_9BACT|nr:hypothetical protein [Fodinibius salsisoli]MCW9708039.1 hypothetical protein [Fodinibius salsisoli]
MKYLLPLTLFVLAGFMISCSDNPADVKPGDIQIEATETALKVLNGGESAIYYFAVERNLAARINWAPISEKENEIKVGQSKQISLEDLKMKQGDQGLFYYWTAKEPKPGDIRHIIVETE